MAFLIWSLFFAQDPTSIGLQLKGPNPALATSSLPCPDGQPTVDVAVTSIAQVGNPYAYQGDEVTIQVGLCNNGTGSATFDVELYDDTQDLSISTQQTTLAASATTTLDMTWDTSEATGGPPPPGPPTAGTVHSLTATADLDGDEDDSNDSKTLSSGFWIIAVAQETGITFPESLEVPEAKFGEDLTLSKPSIQTTPEKLTKLLVIEPQAQSNLPLAKPSIAVAAEPLSKPFVTWADAKASVQLSAPVVGTAKSALKSIFVTRGVSYASASRMGNPFAGGDIRGQILLQGTTLVLGSYAELEDEMAFTDKNGHFLLPAPSGVHDLVLKAPGYLSTTISGVTVVREETSNIPPATLLYGDANRDQVIDLLDLTLAVRNLGRTAVVSLFGEE